MHNLSAIMLAGFTALLLLGCGSGGGSSAGFLPPTGGGGANVAPALGVSGASGSGSSYSLNLQAGSPIPGTITFNASDANTGDLVTLSVMFNGAASSGYSTLPAQLTLAPTSGTKTATAPTTASVTISPNGALPTAGTLVFTINAIDDKGAATNTTLTITVSSGPAPNNPPSLSAPSGPGAPTGSDPSYSVSLTTGQSLGFYVSATDPDAGNTLNLMASVSSGSLTATQAGFTTSMPAGVSGPSVRVLTLAGSASTAGTITLSISVSDGQGGSDSFTLAITITAAGGGGSSNPSGGSGGAYPGNQSRTITVSGLGSQTYYLYIPNSYNPASPMPVMFGFHGAGGTGTSPAAAQQVRNDWATVAATGNFIVVAQASTGSGGGWLLSNDAAILNDIITDVFSRYNIEQKRIYAWGFSAGGHILHTLALSNSDFFAGYAVNAGVLAASAGTTAPAAAVRKIPVSIYIGTTDTLLTYSQQDRTTFQGAGWVLNTNLYYTEFSGGHTYTTAHLSQHWTKLSVHSLP